MSSKIHLPLYLRQYAADAKVVEANGDTVKACLEDLAARFPDMSSMLFDAPGKVLDYLSVFLNGEFASGEALDRNIEDGADIRVLYVLSGG